MDTLLPVGTHASTHGISGLEANSYTAYKLKHATPEHIHLTTRRFFIGPIPEGWLSSNRKTWYKRRIQLSSYSSRAATFHAAESPGHHPRTATGINTGGTSISFSFPQPEDVDDEETLTAPVDATDTADETDDEFFEPQELLPVSTTAESQLQSDETEQTTPDESRPQRVLSHTLDGQQSPLAINTNDVLSPRHSAKSVRIGIQGPSDEEAHSQAQARLSNISNKFSDGDPSPSMRQHGLDVQHDNLDIGSRTRLISPAASPEINPKSQKAPKSRDGQRILSNHEPAPMSSHSNEPYLKGKRTEGVRFKVGEAVADRQWRVGKKAGDARHRVGNKMLRRQTLQEGTIVKMEKMLVKVDATRQAVPDEYDENGSIKLETQTLEKWREFMVVARRSAKTDDDDFRLQFYKTRVIPEIEDKSSSKKPTREIRLIRGTTHVNLFSSLDKSLVVWHPYRKGSRITVMKCESAANSNEWYTFLRDALGWKRPDTLQVSVPDLDVTLLIDKPFEEVKQAANLENHVGDEHDLQIRAIEAEQAVASRIISQSVDMLKGNHEWSSVIDAWSNNYKPGLAWKRYDRLEWIHGINEQKMYGTMAMLHSYELELRPKVHYPQHALTRKGKDLEEPAPVEGFLIRMTSQKGIHKRMGKTFFKRLYFSTYDHLLVFSRPAQATPPHPPRLQTITATGIPSSQDIIEKTPTMYEIHPFELDHTDDSPEIRWLASGNPERIKRHDLEALEEGRRNHANLSTSDGYINMTRIRKVQPMAWGTDPVDESLSSGSDVDFHESRPDTSREDGTTSQIDDERTFELILDNGLVVRLQAYDKHTRDEWISRLGKLIKYWKARKIGDTNNFKAVRATNLQRLKIDEDLEAELGQFGHKWEVTRSEASPELYNICPISSCRTISLSGMLYRKARRRGTFQRCGVVLAGGKMLIYQSTLRKSSGEQVPNIHQEKQQVIDLKGCYVYSGLIVEDDLLYQNRTFDANHIGTMASLPRVWTEDGWTSTDVDVMCCFVVWMNTRKGWFRTAGNSIFGSKENENTDNDGVGKDGKGAKRAKLRRVRQLGVPGRGMVFKCRSRAERDLWVLNLNIEIERLVERQKWEDEEVGGDVRFAG